MESLVVATGGNPWQMRSVRKRQEQGKTVAPGCDRLPIDGKEGSTVRVGPRTSRSNRCKQACSVACSDASLSAAGTPRVHILGLAGIRAQARRLVSPFDTPPRRDD